MALSITPPGEFGDLPYFGKASTEVRDRFLARTGPHSRGILSNLETAWQNPLGQNYIKPEKKRIKNIPLIILKNIPFFDKYFCEFGFQKGI